MLTLDSRFQIPPHVTSSFVEADAVLLNTRTNQYFALEAVASRLWALLKEGKGLREIHQIMRGEYAVQAAELEQDMLELVRQLMESGLVESAET